jgi:hypothetical protein
MAPNRNGLIYADKRDRLIQVARFLTELRPVDSLGLARIFHTLLASDATRCTKSKRAFAAPWIIRAKFKTAWRFCFSPHFPQLSDETSRGASANRRRMQQECEKCGLRVTSWTMYFQIRSP